MRRIGWRLRKKYRNRVALFERLLLKPTEAEKKRVNPSIEKRRLAAEAYIRRISGTS